MKHVSKLAVLVVIAITGLPLGIYTQPGTAQGHGMKMKETTKPMGGMKEKSGMMGMEAPRRCSSRAGSDGLQRGEAGSVHPHRNL